MLANKVCCKVIEERALALPSTMLSVDVVHCDLFTSSLFLV